MELRPGVSGGPYAHPNTVYQLLFNHLNRLYALGNVVRAVRQETLVQKHRRSEWPLLRGAAALYGACTE
ncbi:hypothetical protein GCM10011359_11990 [Nesterenkonia alkaliphila]|nr:hypothetical protein GCM10011359_11990 [Nesterenkonia alkaliphila]